VTSISATLSGIGVSTRHLAASRYVFPALSALAVTAARSNVGWSSSNWMNR